MGDPSRGAALRSKPTAGFTLIEALITLVIMAVVTSIAIPAFSVWRPNYHLRSAARDVYSTLQEAKLRAVRANAGHRVEFHPGTNRYELIDETGTAVKTIRLDQNGDAGEVTFGYGNATIPAGSSLPGDGVSFSSPVNVATFDARGIGNAGYVYLQNTRNNAYAIGKQVAGMVSMEKWNGSDWE